MSHHPTRTPRPRNLTPPPPPSTPSPFRFVVRKAPTPAPLSSTPAPKPKPNPILAAAQTPWPTASQAGSWPTSTPRFLVRKPRVEEIVEDESSQESRFETPVARGTPKPPGRRYYEDDEEEAAPSSSSVYPAAPSSPLARQAKRAKVSEDILTFSDDEDYAPALPSAPAPAPNPAGSVSAIPKVPPFTKFLPAARTQLDAPVHHHPSAFARTYTVTQVGDTVATGGRFVLGCAEEGGEEVAMVLLRGQAGLIEVGARIGINEGVTVKGLLGDWEGEWKITGKWGFLTREGPEGGVGGVGG